MTVIEYCWGGHLKGTLGSMQKEMKELGGERKTSESITEQNRRGLLRSVSPYLSCPNYNHAF